MENTRKNAERIAELTESLRTTYRTPEVLNQVLSRFLRQGGKSRGGYPIYYCNCHNDKHPGVTVNTRGTIRCGCFPCHIVCNNAIDICQSFGNISSFAEAVVEASSIIGLISTTEAMDLLAGKDIKITSPQMKPRNVVEVPRTTYDKMPYDTKKANVIYRIFSNLNQLNGQPRLTDKDKEELLNKRKLSQKEIDDIGFFSYPTASIKLLINEMKKYGLSENDLAYIPGFYYNREKKYWGYTYLKGEAYCIPIRDANDNIIAIQLRLSGENVSLRYIWLTSTYAMNTEDSNNALIFGNSPGTPLSVVLPKKLKNTTLFITEGFYKAYEFSKTFGCACVSVQGVNNIEGIEDVLTALKEKGYCVNNILIGFDADMAIKETVLKPALKLGARLCEMPEELLGKFDNILQSGVKTEKTICRNFKKEAKEIFTFFEKEHTYNIFYVVWDLEYEKGIDDLIHAGNKDQLHSMPISKFWKNSYQILKELDNYKMEMATVNDELFTKIVVPEQVSTNLFKNIMLIA